MIYELLEPNRWWMAKPLLSRIGQDLPYSGWISAAINDGGIQAVHVLHPCLHGEPVIIQENAKVDFYKLQMPLKRALPKETFYYVFAPSRKIARLAEGSGMESLPWAIFRGKA